MDDFEFSIDFFEDEEEEKKKPEQKKNVHVSHRYGHRHIARKATSDFDLSEKLAWHFEEGDCYHCFSFGDVDSLSYLKHILRQQKIKYLALSTWCMAGVDVEYLQKFYDNGIIGRVDFYLGEIFRGSYPEVYDQVKEFCDYQRSRFVIFRNHSKIMLIKGERFDAIIESSANINTNPRCENTVITVDRSLVNEYIKLFNEIGPFNRDFEQGEPYEPSASD